MQNPESELRRIPLLRLSEKGRRSLQRSTTDHPKALFTRRTPAISTLSALLMHLFGQSQRGFSRKFGSEGCHSLSQKFRKKVAHSPHFTPLHPKFIRNS